MLSLEGDLHNRLLKNSEQETEKQFPCVASHSRAGGNLSESTTYWMPPFAGMTNPVGSPHDGGFPSGLKTRRAQHRVNIIREQDSRSL